MYKVCGMRFNSVCTRLCCQSTRFSTVSVRGQAVSVRQHAKKKKKTVCTPTRTLLSLWPTPSVARRITLVLVCTYKSMDVGWRTTHLFTFAMETASLGVIKS